MSETGISWWIIHDERKIGELINPLWVSESEFWHEYNINLFDNSYDKLKEDRDEWDRLKIKLEDKKNPIFFIENFIIGVISDKKIKLRIIY